MAVAAQRGADRRAALGHRLAAGRLQPPQVDRHLAVERLGDRAGGDLADAGGAPGASRRARDATSAGTAPDHRRGRPERPDPVGGLARPLEQEGDLPQIGNRVTGWRHGST